MQIYLYLIWIYIMIVTKILIFLRTWILFYFWVNSKPLRNFKCACGTYGIIRKEYKEFLTKWCIWYLTTLIYFIISFLGSYKYRRLVGSSHSLSEKVRLSKQHGSHAEEQSFSCFTAPKATRKRSRQVVTRVKLLTSLPSSSAGQQPNGKRVLSIPN